MKSEVKNSLKELKRLKLSEERICELEDRSIEIIQFEEQKKKIRKNEQNLRDLWVGTKPTNTCIMRVPEERKERKRQINI